MKGWRILITSCEILALLHLRTRLKWLSLLVKWPTWIFTRSHVASIGPQSICFNASIVFVTFALAKVSDLFQRLGGLFAVAFLHFWLWWLLNVRQFLESLIIFCMTWCKWEKQFVLRVYICPSRLQAEIWLKLIKVALVWQRPTFSLQLSSQMGVSLGGLL